MNRVWPPLARPNAECRLSSIAFDIDIILLVPWAIALRPLGLFGLGAMIIFLIIFVLGDIWVWKKGVLEWE